MGEYVVYGSDLSFFTMKLHTAMSWTALPWVYKKKTNANQKEVEARSGTHQIPVLATPERWMIADTTPLLHLLDARARVPFLYPRGVLGAVVAVLEEFFDEWISRLAVHYRWSYEESAAHAAPKLGADAIDGSEMGADERQQLAEAVGQGIAQWGKRAVRALGMSDRNISQAAEREFHALLALLDDALRLDRCIFGATPTALDAVVLGGLRAHFLEDPVPKRQLAAYTRVQVYCREYASLNRGGGSASGLDLGNLQCPRTRFVREVLRQMNECGYGSYLRANARALEERKKVVTVQLGKTTATMLARPYPEMSRRMLNEFLSRHLLEERDRTNFESLLAEFELTELFSCREAPAAHL